MLEKDYYQILGVSETASKKEIKDAFHRLAKKYHPDKNKSSDAEVRFKEINEANQILSNEKKRAEYDRIRKYGARGASGWGGFPQGSRTRSKQEVDFDFSSADFDFDDIFSSLFGGMNRQTRKSRRRTGSNINAVLEIDFESSLRGGKIPFSINRQATCESCNGTGSKSGHKNVCKNCNGQGFVQLAQGAFAMNRPCNVCGGEGFVIDDPCPKCNGKGFVNKNQVVEVKIPKGVNTGQIIRLSGLGNAGENGASAGDLLLEMHVKPHHIFKREGKDIYSDVEISMLDAALGAKVNILTVDGFVELSVPAGTQPGTKLRLRGKGVETKGSRGNHYVVVKVRIPKNLSDKQRKILEELKNSLL